MVATMPTMRAAVLVAPHRIEIEQRPIPAPGPGEVVIRVERCGICGTDLHIYNGHYSADRLPLVPGHEFAGRIASLGAGVAGLAEGQKVIADINIGCGHCFYCRRNEILSCASVEQLGIHRDGAFADYVRVPARLVIPLPDDMPFEIAALTEPLSCVVRAARRSRLQLAESVLVLGAGPIGNLHVQLARLMGAGPVIAADLDPARAALAKECGADAVVSDPAALADTVRGLTGGRGADVVIESVGSARLYGEALSLVRPGGRIAAFGLTPADAVWSVPPLDIVLREIGVQGSVAGMGEDMHTALHLLALGRIRTAPFTRVTYPLTDLDAAIRAFAGDRTAFKVQIAA